MNPLPSVPETPAAQAPPGGRLEALFRDYGRLVFKAAFRVTGSPSDAEDVVQTVFLRLMANEHLDGLGSSPGGYLRRAGTNAALDVLRRRSTRSAVPIEDGVERRLSDEGKSPEERVENEDLKRELRRALSTLEGRAAETFALRYFEGLGNQEIAEVLGTSSGVVAVTLHRARRRLQDEMSEFLGERR